MSTSPKTNTSPKTIPVAIRPGPSTQPANPLARSYTEPTFRALQHAEPSMLVEALDVTAFKRSKSSVALTTLPPPQVVAPQAPALDQTLTGRTVFVRSIINNANARERVLAKRGQGGADRDPRMSHMPLLQVLIDDLTGTRYLVSPPVRGGAHGEFHIVRRERPDRPSDLWAAKQVRIRHNDPTAPLQAKASIGPRDPHDISREMCAMLTARSPIVPTLLLRSGDRIFAMGPLCDGDLEDIKPHIDGMDAHVAQLFLADIVLQVARRLKTCHENLLAHRDIKPGNILFKRNGQVYLADFSFVANTTDVPGEFAGTLGFIAPEHMKYGSLDPKIDIFSLGCTLLDLMSYTPFEPEYMPRPADSEAALLEELMLGHPPERTAQDAMSRVAEWEQEYRAWYKNPQSVDFTSAFADLDRLFAGIQQNYPDLFPIVLDMIANDPDDRLSAEELVDELEAIPRAEGDEAALAATWATIPRAPELDAIFKRWHEPHLPILRRTTSVDNLPRLTKTMSADNGLLGGSHEV